MLWKILLKVQYKAEKKRGRLVFGSFLCNFHACSSADTYSGWLVRTVPRRRETGISLPQHSFDDLVLKFLFSRMHYRFSRMSFVLPVTFCRASQRPYIYFCATGRLNGERPCRCCDLSFDVKCFPSYVHDCGQVFEWNAEAAELWMLSLVCIDPLDGFVCVSLFRLSNWCFRGNQSKAVCIGYARQAIRLTFDVMIWNVIFVYLNPKSHCNSLRDLFISTCIITGLGPIYSLNCAIY